MAKRGRPPVSHPRSHGVFVRFSDTEWGALQQALAPFDFGGGGGDAVTTPAKCSKSRSPARRFAPCLAGLRTGSDGASHERSDAPLRGDASTENEP